MPEVLMIIVWILVAAIAVSVLVRSVRVIRQQQVAVVERLGKFRRTLIPVRTCWCRGSTGCAT